jgi:hypothetical protein
MKIAVLACGPSLVRHFDTRERFDLVIAVNTAGWLYACDWLAFSDKHIIDPVLAGDYEKPRAGLLSNKGWRDYAEAIGLRWEPLPLYDWRLKNLTPEMCDLCIGQGMTECGFTFPNALHFAGLHGCMFGDQVHVFGFDCAMIEGDVAGVKGYHNRKRWLSELPWIREVWNPKWLARCEAHPLVIEYVSGKVPLEALDVLFPKC